MSGSSIWQNNKVEQVSSSKSYHKSEPSARFRGLNLEKDEWNGWTWFYGKQSASGAEDFMHFEK